MAQIVGALGVPHTPAFPALVARDGPDCETARLFAEQRRQLEALWPDAFVMFDTDHLNTFFFDNLPIYAIGVADQFEGPNDDVAHLPPRQLSSDRAFAQHLHRSVVGNDFDVSLVENFTVDHSVAVPMHFLGFEKNAAIIPFFISGHVPPLPSARRCFELGKSLRAAIESWPKAARVVVIGSGSFSLEVYGPWINPDQSFGVPNPEWASRVFELLRAGEVETLLDETTPQQLKKAGNVGGEILNWIAMLGAAGRGKPDWIELQPQFGHGYGVWAL